jgi:signal transduction histidine kinase
MDVTPEEVERAVRHVVENAIYAARAASPHLDAPPRVCIETVASANRVAIRVRDNGTGVVAADRERLFEPFYTTKPPGEGTGLGLALTYDVIVTRHGGSISVDSEDGEGTMITLSLPAATAPLPEVRDMQVATMA